MPTITSHFVCGPNSPNVPLSNDLWALPQLQYENNSPIVWSSSCTLLNHVSLLGILKHSPKSFDYKGPLTHCKFGTVPFPCQHQLLWHPDLHVLFLHLQWHLHTGHCNTLHPQNVPLTHFHHNHSWRSVTLPHHTIHIQSPQYPEIGMFSLRLVSTKPFLNISGNS